MFWVLGLIWGSSFLLIKVAVAPDGAIPAQVGLFDPFSLATIRLSLAALGFIGLLALTRRKIPTSGRTLLYLTITGLFNNAIPYVLITWGERTIDSGLASVLNATTPLFGLLIAHMALADDRISLGKVLGLISGFAGILLLATRSIDPLHPNPLIGQLALIGASLSYAFAAVFMRRTLRGLDAMTTAGVSISAGALLLILVSLFVVHPLPVFSMMQPVALLAILILGLVNTFIAYIFYFNIIAAWGASRATMVTYLPPPLGVTLGIVLEHEPFDWKLLVGSVLIVGGVALANLWRGSVKTALPTAVVEATPTGK